MRTKAPTAIGILILAWSTLREGMAFLADFADVGDGFSKLLTFLSTPLSLFNTAGFRITVIVVGLLLIGVGRRRSTRELEREARTNRKKEFLNQTLPLAIRTSESVLQSLRTLLIHALPDTTHQRRTILSLLEYVSSYYGSESELALLKIKYGPALEYEHQIDKAIEAIYVHYICLSWWIGQAAKLLPDTKHESTRDWQDHLTTEKDITHALNALWGYQKREEVYAGNIEYVEGRHGDALFFDSC
jgi:hypothetical protein